MTERSRRRRVPRRRRSWLGCLKYLGYFGYLVGSAEEIVLSPHPVSSAPRDGLAVGPADSPSVALFRSLIHRWHVKAKNKSRYTAANSQLF